MDSEARHVCQLCGKSYKYMSTLNRHSKYECNKPPMFHCTQCTYKTHRKSSLELHYYTLHKTNKFP